MKQPLIDVVLSELAEYFQEFVRILAMEDADTAVLATKEVVILTLLHQLDQADHGEDLERVIRRLKEIQQAAFKGEVHQYLRQLGVAGLGEAFKPFVGRVVQVLRSSQRKFRVFREFERTINELARDE